MPGQLQSGGNLPFSALPNGVSGPGFQADAMGVSQNDVARPDLRNARATVPREPEVLHRPTPYNLLSLRDLYTQLPEQNGQLKRFGSDVFLRRNDSAVNQLIPNTRETL